jgi:hypothetical protein
LLHSSSMQQLICQAMPSTQHNQLLHHTAMCCSGTARTCTKLCSLPTFVIFQARVTKAL